MLMTHYREPIDFSHRRLEEAEAVLARLWRRAGETVDSGDVSTVVESLADDLNTVDAHSRDERAVRRAAARGAGAVRSAGTAPTAGIDLDAVQKTIDERLAFIADKNWAEADRIRDELLGQGIQLKDGKDPETGERVTTWEVKR
jgi:cysteinyl-tRNA synthetase